MSRESEQDRHKLVLAPVRRLCYILFKPFVVAGPKTGLRGTTNGLFFCPAPGCIMQNRQAGSSVIILPP